MNLSIQIILFLIDLSLVAYLFQVLDIIRFNVIFFDFKQKFKSLKE